jgi:hypothetical protein
MTRHLVHSFATYYFLRDPVRLRPRLPAQPFSTHTELSTTLSGSGLLQQLEILARKIGDHSLQRLELTSKDLLNLGGVRETRLGLLDVGAREQSRLDRLRELFGRDLGDVLPNNVYMCQQTGSPSSGLRRLTLADEEVLDACRFFLDFVLVESEHVEESNIVDMDRNAELRWNARVRLAGQDGQKDSVRALEKLLLLGGVDVAADDIPRNRSDPRF